MAKKLLTEFFPLDYSAALITEAAGSSGPMVLRNAVLQRSNAKNQNGRVYPREVLIRESQKYLAEFVKQRRALGELDHPEERTVVNLANVSHLITDLRWEGNDLRGDIEILPTPMGNIVKELVRNRIRLGVSSRGVGSVDSLDEGTDEVQDDFNLICFDIVSNPSTQGAFINESVMSAIDRNRNMKVDELITNFFSEFQLGNK